jgi:glutamyl-tRNA reductase
MTILVVGISHRSAPIPLLEKLAVDTDGATKLIEDVLANPHVSEATVVATCNRMEIYAAVDRFHGSVEGLSQRLLSPAHANVEELLPHLYIHYDDGAVSHLFRVAAGLDSMAVGEAQILGQTRDALQLGQELGSVGPVLNTLFQQALRVGKRAHAETGIDRVSVSLVESGLEHAARTLGPLEGTRVLVVGAGSMSSLAATTVSRLGARELVIINRTHAKAEHLAAATGGLALPFAALESALAQADLVISCTGAVGHVVGAAAVAAAVAVRGSAPQVYVDLALPRDVDPAVGALPGVEVFGLGELGEAMAAAGESTPHLKAAQDLVVAEVAAYLTGRRAQAVAPTVAALRSRAADVVAAEMNRLEQRLPSLGEQTRAEVQLAVHRVVEKLLHTPTVRVKELAGEGQGGDYAQALRDLFDLDPHDVAAVSVPPETGPLT